MNGKQNVVVAARQDDPARVEVSAFIDGELDEADVDRVIDALLASDDLADFWCDACRAGDWMRSEEVVGVGDGHSFLRRFSTKLAHEPAIIAAKRSARSRSRRFWVRTGLPGASVAAALVVVAWVAVPSGSGDRARGTAGSVGTPSVAIVQVAQPDAAAVRPAEWKAVDVDRLSDYVAAHHDVTPFSFHGGAGARQTSYNAGPSAPADASTAP